MIDAGTVGATRDEVSAAVDARGAEDRALSRRLTDLRQHSLIEDSGRTRPGASRREQIAWVGTPAGRQRAAQLRAEEGRRHG